MREYIDDYYDELGNVYEKTVEKINRQFEKIDDNVIRYMIRRIDNDHDECIEGYINKVSDNSVSRSIGKPIDISMNDLRRRSNKKRAIKNIVTGMLCALAIIGIVWFNNNYLFQVCQVCGDSMNPTYYNSDTLLVNRFNNTFEHNDVIVFNCQGDEYIKRIAGVPGDKIQIIDGVLYVNDSRCDTIDNNYIGYSGIASNPIILNDDEYFVLGDNYNNSMDSRDPKVGCVNINNIIGRVAMKLK